MNRPYRKVDSPNSSESPEYPVSVERHPWEEIYRTQGLVFQELLPFFAPLVETLAYRGVRRVLDLGCGNGRHVVHLVKAGFNVTGLDISISGMRLTRQWLAEKGLQADTLLADFRTLLPLSGNTFEAIISTQVIHHALLAEIRLAIAEIHRVLVPGGFAMISVAACKDDEVVYDEIEPGTFVPLSGLEQGLPHHLFDPQALHAELDAFNVLDIELRAEGRVTAAWVEKPGKPI
jgi:SAM-dependent methyltransferase